MKGLLLTLYWLPAMYRVTWRMSQGRLFIFRDEPCAFLRFMLWYLADDLPAEFEDAKNLRAHLDDEVAMRQRRGEWA